MAHESDPPLFEASKTKVERARSFIKDLRAEMERYISDDPVSAVVNCDPDPPGQRRIDVQVKGIGLMPGAIIGDAMHNLRTALDLMASELARLNGESDKNVYFPFADSREGLEQAIKNRCFHKVGGDAVDLLREFAPYRGGNHALRAIHDLDVRDKHTALIPIAAFRNLTVEGDYHLDVFTTQHIPVVAHQAHYVFPEDVPVFGQRPVIETLEELVELVEGVVEAFARLKAPAREDGL